MPNAGSIFTNVRKISGDPDRDWFDDTTGFDFLNRAQERFCNNVMPLDEIKDYTITAKENKFDLPTNCIIPHAVIWYQGVVRRLEYKPPDYWWDIEESHPNATGTPELYTVVRRQLWVGPNVPQTASDDTTASGEMSSAVTTLNLVAASGTFRSKGYVKVESEIIEYTGVATTTLTGAIRGVHGTSAATHASGTTVTEIDLLMQYRRSPTVIAASGTSPDIPEFYHPYLEKYVLYLMLLASGETQKAQLAFQEFKEYEETTIHNIARRSRDGMIKIREKWTRGRWYW